ncbi:DUF732 domain-containing protein [Mycobacterium sp. AZCC_0083]|uniref:DUF732 domain-containing protein n=1 Tax=Mycobacterium sp. AZCC_0083 TaxID=2735882 RepID=UPI001793CDE6|nr:DUF732 domain-containing protein [Mycobacterium sp. AZCC_0083]MBB5167616.1 hypothetical protein [Mycobacterium sp. AZCC_0083]
MRRSVAFIRAWGVRIVQRRSGRTPAVEGQLIAIGHCGSDDGDNRIGHQCGTATSTGWRPDPTTRHEGRYFVTDRPTNRVRNGKAETTDPVGGRMLRRYIEIPAPGPQSIRSTWLGTTAMTAIVGLITAAVWCIQHPLRPPPASPETAYLSDLRDSNLAGAFTSDAEALAHGRQVCRQLSDGGPQQGTKADKIAMGVFCPQFSTDFRVLETASVSGTFVLTDSMASMGVSSIASDGTRCEGIKGFSDIGRDTQLTVKNGTGEVLATTALGEGRGNPATCTFAFSLSITGGQDRYVISVNRRGELSYTFDQLQRAGSIQIRLGH